MLIVTQADSTILFVDIIQSKLAFQVSNDVRSP